MNLATDWLRLLEFASLYWNWNRNSHCQDWTWDFKDHNIDIETANETKRILNMDMCADNSIVSKN